MLVIPVNKFIFKLIYIVILDKQKPLSIQDMSSGFIILIMKIISIFENYSD